MFGFRAVNLNEAIYDDEANFAYSLTVMDEWGFNHDFPSPQLFNVLYKPFIALFGLQTWVFRLLPWLFGILNTVFVYFFARRNWGKSVAFWSTLLMLVSFYPTLASLQFDVEGSLVMSAILLLFFSYIESESAYCVRKKRFWQILAGVGLGIAVISKYNSVYIVLPLFIYVLMRNKWRLKNTFKCLFLVYFSGFILFVAQLLFAIMIVPQEAANAIPFFSWSTGFGAAYRPAGVSFLGLLMFSLWGTSLLLGFYLLSFWQRRKKTLFFFLWVTGALLFYTLFLTYGSMDRYFMNTIPAMAILGGIYISSLTLKRKHLFFGSVICFFFLIMLFLINSFPIHYISRFPNLYLQELTLFNLNFLFSYTSASGPTFGVNFATIFLSFVLAFYFLVFYLWYRRKNRALAKYCFTVFLFVSIAFNLFLVSEYLFHPTGVAVSDAKKEMISYAQQNELPFPIYSNDEGIQWYFDHYYWHNKENVVSFPDNEIGDDPRSAIESIKERAGTILLLHWPPLHEKSPAWAVVSLCTQKEEFFSKGRLIGEVYTC